MARPELLVVGAGAMGAATAWHAAARLGAEVHLIDRDEVCQGTSPLGAGLIHRLLEDPLDIGLVDRSLEHFQHLAEARGSAFRLHRPGGLLFLGPEHRDQAETRSRLWRAQGLQVTALAPDELRELPGCSGLAMDPQETVYYVENDGWAVTTDAVTALVQAARDAGAELSTHRTVHRVTDRGVVLADGESLAADAVVVAAGVWTPALLEHRWTVPIVAYRPQAACLELPGGPPAPIVHDVVHHTYWRPEGQGKVIIGDGTVLDPQDPVGQAPVEPGFQRGVHARLQARLPAAKGATPVRAWAGYEAGTPDRTPLVGAVPGMENVVLCTGGNGFGFMRAPALGEAAACLALGRAAPLPVSTMDPGRFAAPSRDFRPREGFAWGTGSPAEASTGRPEGS